MSMYATVFGIVIHVVTYVTLDLSNYISQKLQYICKVSYYNNHKLVIHMEQWKQ